MKFKFLILATLFFNLTINAVDKCIKLDSKVLEFFDGTGFLDGHKVHKMIFLGQQLDQFLYGKVDPITKNRNPQHEYKGKFYTLEQLVAIEKEIELLKTKDHVIYQKEHEILKQVLEKLKKEFLDLSTMLLVDAQGAVEQIYQLVRDFTSKYGRNMLEYWEIDKNEVESLHKRVTSIRLCFDISYQLKDFLKAMLCSCPKALQHFKDLQKAGKLKTNQVPNTAPKPIVQ